MHCSAVSSLDMGPSLALPKSQDYEREKRAVASATTIRPDSVVAPDLSA